MKIIVNAVKGGDLRVGDNVALICKVTDTQNTALGTEHVLIRHDGMPSPWSYGNQYLWTWGGKYGSGINNSPDIYRVDEIEESRSWSIKIGPFKMSWRKNELTS